MARTDPKSHGFTCESSTKEQRHFYMNREGMVGRCTRPSQNNYHNYGGRGITFEWKNFEDFKNDMWPSYKEHVEKHGTFNTTLDRIDVNGNYCKENCRWLTRKEQSSNKRDTTHVIINGEDYTSRRLADKIGITIPMARNRLNKYAKGKMPLDKVFSPEKINDSSRNYKTIIIYGVEYSSAQISELCGITKESARNRMTAYREGRLKEESVLSKTKLLKSDFI